mmetsp:Transcript_16743/g.22578  ORF Transcript_16743/g.22578 Transcript_16743/m.22578 type:complete len:152 (+) Transcript_16743:125-580(+)|eukprot:CAMPEP_0185573374 /NCGR_PEP_ID=MMETSP0434-20130131/5108_1 /TAXON_ID=626734 ORGANISM="Favella taraikaensis, Strain Fe Narragansett Bay" /NCGR_SAMPLE_ID=MMETSP0434 /ASSEMBLY_ACC=CAM_ASM_000379 /LENGTH=151 /DNA_ID=CAMNT_0028189585 /DNA_START=113 /DNA_END=568 /DNA_ORIENTATION=+
MLIGIMGDTFGKVSETREQLALAEKIKILADYVIIVRHAPADLDKFLYSVTSSKKSSQEADTWEGTVTALKRAIIDSQGHSEAFILKKLNSVNDGMESITDKMAKIDKRINELSGSQHRRQQDMEKIVRTLPQELNNTMEQFKFEIASAIN